MPLWHGKAKMINLLPFRQPSCGRAMMITMIHLHIWPPQLPSAFDAAAFFSANSTLSSPSTHPAAFPTASDAADLFLSSSDTNLAGSRDSNADANADTNAESDVEDISSAESPTTSQIERCTPSRITLPIYSHVDFSYIDDTWLPGSDDMMDTSENE
jgi:hypothetical protein